MPVSVWSNHQLLRFSWEYRAAIYFLIHKPTHWMTRINSQSLTSLVLAAGQSIYPTWTMRKNKETERGWRNFWVYCVDPTCSDKHQPDKMDELNAGENLYQLWMLYACKVRRKSHFLLAEKIEILAEFLWHWQGGHAKKVGVYEKLPTCCETLKNKTWHFFVELAFSFSFTYVYANVFHLWWDARPRDGQAGNKQSSLFMWHLQPGTVTDCLTQWQALPFLDVPNTEKQCLTCSVVGYCSKTDTIQCNVRYTVARLLQCNVRHRQQCLK